MKIAMLMAFMTALLTMVGRLVGGASGNDVDVRYKYSYEFLLLLEQ